MKLLHEMISYGMRTVQCRVCRRMHPPSTQLYAGHSGNAAIYYIHNFCLGMMGDGHGHEQYRLTLTATPKSILNWLCVRRCHSRSNSFPYISAFTRQSPINEHYPIFIDVMVARMTQNVDCWALAKTHTYKHPCGIN